MNDILRFFNKNFFRAKAFVAFKYSTGVYRGHGILFIYPT